MNDQEATMPEPMTLEEAKRRYDAASAELDRICQGPRANFRMRIPAQRDDSDLILGDALVALRDMTRVLVVERDDKAELVKALKVAAALAGHRVGTQFQPLDPASPTVLLQLRVPQELLERAQSAAESAGVTRSEWVRAEIEAALD